jgi:hypothetical protein
MRALIETLGGRRFVMSMLIGAAATVLQWFGKLDPAGAQYAIIILGTVAAYITGNTAQKIKGAAGGGA